jgi:hypothetical protein
MNILYYDTFYVTKTIFKNYILFTNRLISDNSEIESHLVKIDNPVNVLSLSDM